MSDPMLPPNTNYCKCPTCLEYFNSVYPFDLHRIGGGCLTPKQMEEKGMAKNARGYWISRPRMSL